MHLLRIQVPDFRVLKNVDITFEKDFVPKIFPLGSLNGGGKSTLLQLIFTLLHCSGSDNIARIHYLKNLLYGFDVKTENEQRTLAIIHIWTKKQKVEIEFLSCKDVIIKNFISNLNEQEKKEYFDYIRFSNPAKKQKLWNMAQKQNLEQRIEYLATQDNADVALKLKEAKLELNNINYKQGILDLISQKIDDYLKKSNSLCICNYSSQGNPEENEVLLCKVKNLETTEVDDFFNQLSKKIFLAAPSTQVFLFLPKEIKQLLFKTIDKKKDYSSQLNKIKPQLSGFFTYDFLGVDLIVKVFEAARDRDFEEAIKTGEYGQNYKNLINELKILLGNKKINLSTDLAGVTFKLIENGEEIELYPEDLSHGEVKRLSIYIWLKYCNIEDAIVLMDEIEIAFHPDWQYQIIADLDKWGASNQYILATHSYELCQALTPAHVKELEPKLIKPKAK